MGERKDKTYKEEHDKADDNELEALKEKQRMRERK